MKNLNKLIKSTATSIALIGSVAFFAGCEQSNNSINYSLDDISSSQTLMAQGNNSLYHKDKYNPLINILNEITEYTHNNPLIKITKDKTNINSSNHFVYTYPNAENSLIVVFGENNNNLASILLGFMQTQIGDKAEQYIQSENKNGMLSYNDNLYQVTNILSQVTSIALLAKMAADNPENKNYYQNLAYENIVGYSASQSLAPNQSTQFINFINLDKIQKDFFNEQSLNELKKINSMAVINKALEKIENNELAVTNDDKKLVEFAVNELNGIKNKDKNNFNNDTKQAMKDSIIKSLYEIERKTSNNIFVNNIRSIPQEELTKFARHYPISGEILKEAYKNQILPRQNDTLGIQSKQKEKSVKDIYDIPEISNFVNNDIHYSANKPKL